MQVPVLFTGSMRSNLDPFGRHSDDACWEALERAHLAKMVQVQPCKNAKQASKQASKQATNHPHIPSMVLSVSRELLECVSPWAPILIVEMHCQGELDVRVRAQWQVLR